MSLEKLNYYGYNKETYVNCLDMIQDTDMHHAKILNFWFTVLCIVVFFLLRWDDFTLLAGNPIVYLSYFFIALVWDLLVIFAKEFTLVKARIAVILNILFLLSFSIYCSIMQPYMSASIFPVIIVVIAISYINTFFIMGSILLSGSAFFLWTSFVFKPLAITYIDIFYTVLFLTLAFALHYSFQRMRISRFVTYYEKTKIQRDLEIRSSFDALTSLLNRGRFFSMASEIIKGSHEDYIVLCLFDLDGFKQINDKLGHQMGDKAIQLAGEHLLKGFGINFGEKWNFEERAVKEKLSFAGRLGGDEFIVFLRGRKSRNEIKEEAQKLLDALANVKAGELNGLHSSVGIVELSAEDSDIDIAYTKADEALYQSKAAGKHTITFSKEG